MKEDHEIESLVRASLEENLGLSPDRLRALLATAGREAKRRQARRQLLHWGVPALLAASVAVALGLQLVFSGRTARRADGMVETIGLLCELDGLSPESFAATTPGELLLAWQEAPCADLL